MRPTDLYDIEQLRQARERGEELAESWRSANYRRANSSGQRLTPPLVGLRVAREAAGRALITVGQWVRPAGAEPCA